MKYKFLSPIHTRPLCSSKLKPGRRRQLARRHRLLCVMHQLSYERLGFIAHCPPSYICRLQPKLSLSLKFLQSRNYCRRRKRAGGWGLTRIKYPTVSYLFTGCMPAAVFIILFYFLPLACLAQPPVQNRLQRSSSHWLLR